jgi:pilus assembly protein CpaF
MNTGHEGGCGTLHANSCADVPARVEALAMAAGMPRDAVHSQLASAVDVVVHVGRRHGERRVEELAVLRRGADGVVRAEPAVTFDADRTIHTHPAAGHLEELLW